MDDFKNATIFFKNGEKQLCDVVSITEKGVHTGHINNTIDESESVIRHGFIPKYQIEKIIIGPSKGTIKEIIFSSKKNSDKEEKNENIF